MPDDGDRAVRADLIEHGERVAQIGVPGVQPARSLAVPRRSQLTTPPSGVGQLGGENVERAGEIEPAVDAEDRWCARVTPP